MRPYWHHAVQANRVENLYTTKTGKLLRMLGRYSNQTLSLIRNSYENILHLKQKTRLMSTLFSVHGGEQRP